MRKHLHYLFSVPYWRRIEGGYTHGTNKSRHAAKICCCLEKIAMRSGDGSAGRYVEAVPFICKKEAILHPFGCRIASFLQILFYKTVVQLHLSAGDLA